MYYALCMYVRMHVRVYAYTYLCMYVCMKSILTYFASGKIEKNKFQAFMRRNVCVAQAWGRLSTSED